MTTGTPHDRAGGRSSATEAPERLQMLPLVVLVFAAGAGVGTAGGHALPVGVGMVACGLVLACGFALGATVLGWRAWWGAAAGLGVAGAGVVLAAGCWWADARLPRPGDLDLSRLAPLRLVRALARVDSEPAWTGDRWKFEARAVAALFPRSAAASGRVAVVWRPGERPAVGDGSGARYPPGAGAAGRSSSGTEGRASSGAVGPASPGAGPVGERPRFGDLVLLTGSLRSIEPPTNPGQPDYAAWAARRGIFSRIRATRMAIVAPGDAPWNAVRLAGDVKERAVALIGAGLPPPRAALAGSLLFGAGAVPVEPETRQTFTDLGLAHILAASGMQTTLLVGLALGVGRAIGLGAVPRCAAAGVLATFFAAMCGFAPSILRATWMSGAALLAEATGRQAIGTRTLWLSALAMLIATPVLVLDLGFQFSFLATYGLLTTGSAIRRALVAASGRLWAARQFRGVAATAELSVASGAPGGAAGGQAGGQAGRLASGLGGGQAWGQTWGDRAPFEFDKGGRGGRARPGKLPPWAEILIDGLSAPIAAFIWCVPLQISLFGRLSLWSLPANWYAEGFVVLLTYSGFVLAGAGLVWNVLAAPAPWILGPLIASLEGGLEVLHRLPGAAFSVPAPPVWVAGLAYAALALGPAVSRVVALLGAARPPAARPVGRASCLPGGLASVCVAAGILAAGSARGHPPPGALELTVLDVGQGDAIVVRSLRGGCHLVDAGPAGDGWDAGQAIVLPALAALGCRRLGLAIVTHAHADHMGGMASVVSAMPVGEAWDAGQSDGPPGYGALLASILGAGTPLGVPRSGTLRITDGVEWRVLAPAPRPLAGTRSDANNNGIVVRLRYGAARVLLAADLEEVGERSLLERVPAAYLAADIFKAPHHGSRFGATPEFLAAVRPRASVVSVGRDNRFGHPDASTVARLEAFGPVFRTDRHGAVSIRVTRTGWTLHPWMAPETVATPRVTLQLREGHDVAR